MAQRLLVTRTDKIQLLKITLAVRLTRALCKQPQAGSAFLVTPPIANTNLSEWPLACQSSAAGCHMQHMYIDCQAIRSFPNNCPPRSPLTALEYHGPAM